MKTINDRVAALRQWMRSRTHEECDTELTVEAYIVPTADPHNSEYVPAHWMCREWLTGFTGSAGLAIVTPDEAALWTDSRYWLQAEEQLADTPFHLMREGAEGVPSPQEWLAQKGVSLENGQLVAGPYDILSDELRSSFMDLGVEFDENFDGDFFEEAWTDRPALPAAPISVQPLRYAGQEVSEKLDLLKELIYRALGEIDDLHSNLNVPVNINYDAYVVNDLSDIAWTLNLRGADIPYNPVFVAYLAYDFKNKSFTLYTHHETLTAEARTQIAEAGVQIAAYEDLTAFVASRAVIFSQTASVRLVSSSRLYEIAEASAEPLRAVKNEAECQGFRTAMLRDGVALVKFLRWLDESMAAGRKVTEVSADERLTALRAEQEGFCELSFATIAGYAAHGAIVHYEADAQTDATLKPEGLLLLDSGAQFDCGTTDITRTIALGPVTDEERRVYTHVLKGHLALARLRFPAGSNGLQLDLAARQSMWSEGYDFGHGTGHGVGSHLCVHEGPHQIRKDKRTCTAVPFVPGMTITDEPGIYVAGKFGVRIENVLLCREWRETDFGKFLEFENLTLCPYDLRPVDLAMLTADEKAQINDYHERVRKAILPLLSDAADKAWLEAATSPID